MLGGCELWSPPGESWQMSQVRELLPSGPEGPARAAPAASSFLISLPRGKFL